MVSNALRRDSHKTSNCQPCSHPSLTEANLLDAEDGDLRGVSLFVCNNLRYTRLNPAVEETGLVVK
jgi:hypothetical protein